MVLGSGMRFYFDDEFRFLLGGSTGANHGVPAFALFPEEGGEFLISGS